MKGILNALLHPPLPTVGAGVVYTWAGRIVIYGTLGYVWISNELYIETIFLLALLLVDTAVMTQVLASLREHMGYEVRDRLLQDIYPSP